MRTSCSSNCGSSADLGCRRSICFRVIRGCFSRTQRPTRHLVCLVGVTRHRTIVDNSRVTRHRNPPADAGQAASLSGRDQSSPPLERGVVDAAVTPAVGSRRALAASIGVVVAALMPGFVTASVAPLIRDDFGFGESALGLALSLFYVICVVFSMASGGIVRRMGVRGAMVAAGVSPRRVVGDRTSRTASGPGTQRRSRSRRPRTIFRPRTRRNAPPPRRRRLRTRCRRDAARR